MSPILAERGEDLLSGFFLSFGLCCTWVSAHCGLKCLPHLAQSQPISFKHWDPAPESEREAKQAVKQPDLAL